MSDNDHDDYDDQANDKVEALEDPEETNEITDDRSSGIQENALVECNTTAGPFTINLIKSWSPIGYDRAATLFERSFYDNSHLFRVIPNFLVQFGISYTDDQVLQGFADNAIMDDPKNDISFEEGVVSFAGSGPNSRTSHIFIAYGPSKSLGTQPWETPIGEVVDGMENLHRLYSGYGDGKPHGLGPEQWRIRSGGKKFMNENYPDLDAFLSCETTRKKYINGKLIEENEVESKVETKVENKVENKEKITRRMALRQNAKKIVEDGGNFVTVFTAAGIIMFILVTLFVCKGRGKKPSGKKS